jgi:hypothetical protein
LVARGDVANGSSAPPLWPQRCSERPRLGRGSRAGRGARARAEVAPRTRLRSSGYAGNGFAAPLGGAVSPPPSPPRSSSERPCQAAALFFFFGLIGAMARNGARAGSRSTSRVSSTAEPTKPKREVSAASCRRDAPHASAGFAPLALRGSLHREAVQEPCTPRRN